jgi:transcriptional regulator with XRE-family HTH domain
LSFEAKVSQERSRKKHPILIEFAKQVRKRRHDLGLTQEELAEKSDFHVNFIGGIERATRNPSLISIVKLAKALEISPREFLPL